MEQFNLEKYIANPSRKVVTRDGRPVRIICTDMKSYNEQIVGLIMGDSGMEFIFTWTQQGKQYLNMDTPNDLFFAPEQHEGWVNVYFHDHLRKYCGGIIYTSKEAAEKNKDIPCRRYVTTIKIDWED